jgi:hypothetical protein
MPPVQLGGQIGAARHEGVAKLRQEGQQAWAAPSILGKWGGVTGGAGGGSRKQGCPGLRAADPGGINTIAPEAEGPGPACSPQRLQQRCDVLPTHPPARPPTSVVPSNVTTTSAFRAIRESWVWPHSGDRSSAGCVGI